MAWEEEKFIRVVKLLELTYKGLKPSYETQQGIIGTLEIISDVYLASLNRKERVKESAIDSKFRSIITEGYK